MTPEREAEIRREIAIWPDDDDVQSSKELLTSLDATREALAQAEARADGVENLSETRKWMVRAKAAESRLAALAGALKTYGTHRDYCANINNDGYGCDCGLAAALTDDTEAPHVAKD